MKHFLIVAVGLLTAQLAAAAPAHVELQQQLSSKELELQNLSGNITIVPASGSQFEITARVTAHAEPAATADVLARGIRLDVRGTSVNVLWPKQYDTVYTPDAPDMSWPLRTTIRYLDQRIALTRDRTKGVDLRVDLRIGVPAGARLKVRNHFGYVHAEGVEAELDLGTKDGLVSSSRTVGRLVADTGSSDIKVLFHRGTLSADTGSGSIHIEGSEGELAADTGSGDVRVVQSRGALVADTGSGDISIDRFTGSIEADTGSGDVHAAGIAMVDKFHADTGSGDVYLDGDLAALRDLDVDTGAGDVTLISSTAPSLRIELETGAGEVEVTGASIVRTGKGDDEKQVVVLGKGAAEASIETGSGDIALKFPAAATAAI